MPVACRITPTHLCAIEMGDVVSSGREAHMEVSPPVRLLLTIGLEGLLDPRIRIFCF